MAQGRDAPCRDCKKRHMGCHSECEEYKRFDEGCEERRRQRALNGVYLGFAREGRTRRRKAQGRRMK